MCMGSRMQPCDAGYWGTLSAPCMAIPPLKYTGLYSRPSTAWRQPEMRRLNLYAPGGVMATPHQPFSHQFLLEPVEIWVMRRGVVPFHTMAIGLTRPTSTVV